MNRSADRYPGTEQLEDAVGVLGCDARLHPGADVEDQQGRFASPLQVQREPVARVGCSPEAALAGTPGHGLSLDAADVRVRDPLVASHGEVIAADGDSVLIRREAAVLVQGLSHAWSL